MARILAKRAGPSSDDVVTETVARLQRGAEDSEIATLLKGVQIDYSDATIARQAPPRSLSRDAARSRPVVFGKIDIQSAV